MSVPRRKTEPLQSVSGTPAFGDRVKVLIVPWQDTRSGQIGTVKRVVLRAGELCMTVEFDDGERRDYYYPDGIHRE